MCHLPIEIGNDENIVRVIFHRDYVKSGPHTYKHQVFRSGPPGTDEVSVIRHSYMGSDFCKQKGKEIAVRRHKDSFVGFAVLRTRAVLDTGSTVHDSRKYYCGHAHISHGFTVEPNEPPEAENNMRLTARCKALRDAAAYYPDPNPATPNWTGPDF